MGRRCALHRVAAAWLAVAGIAAQSAPGGSAGTLRERIAATDAAMPASGGRLGPAHVELLEALLAELPASLDVAEQGALTALLGRTSGRWLVEAERGELEPRMLAWCKALAAHPSVGPLPDGYLAYWEGELHYTARRSDEAVEAFVRAAANAELLRRAARGRAFRVDLARQYFRAARLHLDAAKRGMEPLRQLVYEAQFAERLGLFDRAARSLELAHAVAVATVAVGKEIEQHDSDQLGLVALELLLLRQDFEALEPHAVAMMQRSQPKSAVHDRALLRVLYARVGRGESVSLAVLEELFARASKLNKPDIAVMWIAEALRAGDRVAAAAIAAKLLDGQSLDDAAVTLQALVAAGQSELHPDLVATLASERRRQWIVALGRYWQALLHEWREVEADGEALAFLQMDVRRDALSLLLRAHAVDPGAGAACLEHFLAADASGSTARRLALPVATVDDVLQRVVPPRGALLVFLPAPVGSHVLIVAHDGIEVVSLPPEGTLRRQVAALRAALADSDGAGDDESLRALAQPIGEQVMPPELAARLARYDTLVVAGYELLHALPLEVLPLADAPGWLGLRHAIVYVASVTLALHLADRHLADGYLVDGHVAERAGAAPAPLVRVLAATRVSAADERRFAHAAVRVGASALRDAVAAIAPAAIDIRRDATPADLATAEPAMLGIVIGHGVRDAGRSCPSGMLLGSADGAATGAVFATDLPARGLPCLMCLGVCGARRSSLKAGEDGGHRFTSAFLTGGSDAVLATDLDVRLAEALAVFTALADELVRTPELANAWLQARQRLAAAGGGVRSWAAFRLEGRPTTVVRLPAAPPSRAPWLAIAIGGALTLALAILAVVRRRRG